MRAPRYAIATCTGIIDGTQIGAIGVTEPGIGSDSAGMQTRITFDEATQEWVINGFKRYISNASVADTYIVYGITVTGRPGAERHDRAGRAEFGQGHSLSAQLPLHGSARLRRRRGRIRRLPGAGRSPAG